MRRQSSIALIVGLLAGVAGMLTFPGEAQACDRNNNLSNSLYGMPNYSTTALYNNSLYNNNNNNSNAFRNALKKQRKKALRAQRMANNAYLNSMRSTNPYVSNVLANNGLNGCPNSLTASPYLNNPYAYGASPTLVNNPYGYGNVPYVNSYNNPYATNGFSNNPFSTFGTSPVLSNGV
ncbi:MAG: hypothetical protein K2Z81_28540, partial [Cyanobacteria bacterium]|nr:hypothetical protein [Cyanobacteriota bacterium]